MQNIRSIHKFLTEQLPNHSECKNWTIHVIRDLSDSLTDDPGHEQFYMALIEPQYPDGSNYTNHEPCINIRALNNTIQELDIAKARYALTIENYIGLNNTLLLPITLLS